MISLRVATCSISASTSSPFQRFGFALIIYAFLTTFRLIMIGLGLTISRQLSSLPANQELVKSFIASQTILLAQYYLHKGKSVWVYYALRRCLAESKPVIWYYCGACYLFVEGVYRMPTYFEIQGFVWTLVDSDSSSEGALPHLADHGTRHFIIYSTAPRRERWSRLHKTMRVTVVIMNPWTRAEIVRASDYPLTLRRCSTLMSWNILAHCCSRTGSSQMTALMRYLTSLALPLGCVLTISISLTGWLHTGGISPRQSRKLLHPKSRASSWLLNLLVWTPSRRKIALSVVRSRMR